MMERRVNPQFVKMTDHHYLFTFFRLSPFSSFLKSSSGRVEDVRNYLSGDGKAGVNRAEFGDVYRAVLNFQGCQSEALTVLFFKVIKALALFTAGCGNHCPRDPCASIHFSR